MTIGKGKSDIGRHRLKNEDSMMISNGPIGKLANVYAIADGMGGHKAGNVASTVAIECFEEFVEVTTGNEEETLDILIGGINHANNIVYKMTLENDDYSNMGTTFLACSIKGKNAYIAHVGDCRLYKVNNDGIVQITNDHSFVAELVRAGIITEKEAAIHPERSTITRAVGADSSVTADGIICSVNDGDKIIMCSDGLSNMVDNNTIFDITRNTDLTLEQRIDHLINAANEKGGYDNITVIIIDIEGVN